MTPSLFPRAIGSRGLPSFSSRPRCLPPALRPPRAERGLDQEGRRGGHRGTARRRHHGGDLALALVAEIVGDIVLEEFRRRSGGSKRAQSVLDWLREVAKPPPGVELVSVDGTLFTGMIIVDRNRPVMVLAARQAPGPKPRPPTPPQGPSPYSSPPYHSPSTALQHRLFDEDEEAARRGETPPFWQR